MINPQSFVEYDVPILYRIMTIKQPADDISIEFWDHVVEFYSTTMSKGKQESSLMSQRSEQRVSRSEREKDQLHVKKIQLLFAKGKEGMLTIWRFQNSCLISQKSIKIPYYLSKQITTIRAFTLHYNPNSVQSIVSTITARSHYPSTKFDILTLGYIDGTLQIFQLNISQSSIQLTKCVQIKNSNQQPVTNCQIHDNSQLFVCRTHAVFMYPRLVVDLLGKLLTKSKQKLNSNESLLRVKQLQNSTKISITVSPQTHNLHIYNQLQGVFTFSLPQMHSQGSIMDSIKHLMQTSQGDLIISTADDSIKIVYNQSNEIEKITGLKSFITSIQINQLHKEKLIQLWMADSYGELHYFLKQSSMIGVSSSSLQHHAKGSKSHTSKRLSKQDQQQKDRHQNELVMYQTELNRSLKITQNGIKKIILCDNILLIVDMQMNILLYDVVRNAKTVSSRSEGG